MLCSRRRVDMWWTVFPGIAVGVYQVWAMRVYMRGLGAGGMCGAMIILALITFIRSIDN